MQTVLLILELVGTVSFAISGAMVGLKKNMDIFGICVLGLTTAVGGGIVRDLILGITPPKAFTDPTDCLVAIFVSLLIFLPFVRKILLKNMKVYDLTLLIADSCGLGIFTLYGMKTAMENGFSDNIFLLLFVSVVTGVGGGVMRDIFAGQPPYIFVKHVYACASLLGAIVGFLLYRFVNENLAVIVGFFVIVTIRLLSARFHWSLPKAHDGLFGD